jgi:hypothetical protein
VLGEAGILSLVGSRLATLRPSELPSRKAFVLPIAPVLMPLKAQVLPAANVLINALWILEH